MKSDKGTLEKLHDWQVDRLVPLHSWQRIAGDRGHTLALVPTGLSKEGWLRLAIMAAEQGASIKP